MSIEETPALPFPSLSLPHHSQTMHNPTTSAVKRTRATALPVPIAIAPAVTMLQTIPTRRIPKTQARHPQSVTVWARGLLVDAHGVRQRVVDAVAFVDGESAGQEFAGVVVDLNCG